MRWLCFVRANNVRMPARMAKRHEREQETTHTRNRLEREQGARNKSEKRNDYEREIVHTNGIFGGILYALCFQKIHRISLSLFLSLSMCSGAYQTWNRLSLQFPLDIAHIIWFLCVGCTYNGNYFSLGRCFAIIFWDAKTFNEFGMSWRRLVVLRVFLWLDSVNFNSKFACTQMALSSIKRTEESEFCWLWHTSKLTTFLGSVDVEFGTFYLNLLLLLHHFLYVWV